MKKWVAGVIAVFLMLLLSACGGPKEVTNMKYTVQIFGRPYDGKYTGTILDKVPQGEGRFRFSDADVEITYAGTWEDGSIVGIGDLQFEGMTVVYQDERYVGTYSGEAVKGMPDGHGIFTADLRDGYFEYDGMWKKGELRGTGVLKHSSYILNWSDEKANIGRFAGEVLDGVPSGTGVFQSENPEGEPWTYTGEWKNGLPHGAGVLKFDNDDSYILNGTFTVGEFTPTPAEYLAMEGMDSEFTIPDNIYSFLKEHENMMLSHSLKGYAEEISSKFDFVSFARNPASFGGRVIELTGYIAQIEDWEDFGEHYYFITIAGTNVVYTVYFCGYPTGIIEGNTARINGIPIAGYSYTSVSQMNVNAIVIAGITVEKIR